MYIVYGNGQVKVSQLAPDGFSVVKTQDVFDATAVGVDTIEGNRVYKINGTYYVLNDRPGGTTFIWKSQSPWGPYEVKELVKDMASPVEGGNSPHQGSLIQTADGKRYSMSFTWADPSGRLPVLVKGSTNGWVKTNALPLWISGVWLAARGCSRACAGSG